MNRHDTGTGISRPGTTIVSKQAFQSVHGQVSSSASTGKCPMSEKSMNSTPLPQRPAKQTRQPGKPNAGAPPDKRSVQFIEKRDAPKNTPAPSTIPRKTAAKGPSNIQPSQPMNQGDFSMSQYEGGRDGENPRSVTAQVSNELSTSWADDDEELDAQLANVSLVTLSPDAEKEEAVGAQRKRSSDPTPRIDILREAVMLSKKKAVDAGQREEASGATGGKGENDTHDVNQPPSGRRDSYADIVSKQHPWSDPKSAKKRKREVSGNKVYPQLKGALQGSHKEVYVRKLDYRLCQKFSDVEEMVKLYCRQNGVNVSYAKTIPYDPNDIEIGCKITVKEQDAPTVLSDEFWPAGIEARPWYVRSRNNSRRDYQGDQNESYSR